MSIWIKCPSLVGSAIYISAHQGAIKFILSGADIMCPGLTSKGAFLDMETEKGAGVQVEYNNR